MELASIRVITDDLVRLVAFHEQVTGTTAVWGNEDFAELPTASGTLALAGSRTVPLFLAGAAEPGANRSVILEYLVDDVDAVREKLRDAVEDVVFEPTTMPWGNRAFLFRDPDGNLVNLFTPVTPQARQKYGR